jgi:hypothetical protein
MERRIEALRPEAQSVCREFLRRCRDESGIDVRLHETFRHPQRQEELQKAGASGVRLGWHNFGLAWDFGVYEDGRYVGDGEDPRYDRCGDVAVSLGCKWPIFIVRNGKKVRDSGHVEYHPGFTLAQLQAKIAQGTVQEWTVPQEKGQ